MDRRSFIKGAVVSSLAIGVARTANAASYYPNNIDQTLFENINRVKNPAQKTPLEKSHAPFISAPASVKAGEPFIVEVSVGEKLHVMTPAHWIQDIALYIANEPAGRVEFQPKGFLGPKVQFLVTLSADSFVSGKATLVATQHCNLHGYWEGRRDLQLG